MAREMVSIKLDIKNPKVKEDFERVIESLDDCRIKGLKDPGHTDILILELGKDVEKGFELVASLLSSGVVAEIFLTAHHADSQLLLHGMRTGVREFFQQPIQATEVKQALVNFKEKKAQAKQQCDKHGQIIAVIGSKGGTGTTTIAVNVATSLASQSYDQSVALVDLNRMFGEIPLFLGFEPTYNWGDIVRNISRLDPTYLMSIMYKHPSGVFLLPSPSQLVEDSLASPEIIAQVLKMMEGLFDFIIIDCGHSFDGVFLKVIEMSQTVLLVTILSLPCLANTRKLLTSFNTLGYPPQESVRVVVNRYLKNLDISLTEAEKVINGKVHVTLPNDYKTAMSSINQGKPLLEFAGKSPLTRSIHLLAGGFLPKDRDETSRSKGILGFRLFRKG